MNGIYEDVKTSNNFLRKVFFYMILGILVSAAVPLAIINYQPSLFAIVIKNFRILAIIQLLMVFSLSRGINRINTVTAAFLFLTYSALNGLTLGTIGLVYDKTTIIYVFLITLVVFVVTSIYGFFTKEDLSSYGKFMRIGLISLILISLINMFVGISILYWIGSVVGVVLFTALIAYDVNRIKQMSYYLSREENVAYEKMAIIGALSLYLDFINLFFYLLRFGKENN